MLRSPDLNEKICEPAPKSRYESKDLQSVLRCSDLNEKISEPTPKFRSKSIDSWSVVPIWIMICEPSFQIGTSERESFNCASPLQSPNLNQMIHELVKLQSKSNHLWTCSIPIWIKWFLIRDPFGALWKCESFSCEMWSNANWFGVLKSLFHPSLYVLLKSLQAMSKFKNEWLFWFDFASVYK